MNANRNQLGTVWNAWQDTWSGRIVLARNQLGTITGGRTVETGTSRRTGTRTFVEEEVERESQGFRTISRVAIPVVRARNIRFDVLGMKPFSRIYGFFDGLIEKLRYINKYKKNLYDKYTKNALSIKFGGAFLYF